MSESSGLLHSLSATSLQATPILGNLRFHSLPLTKGVSLHQGVHGPALHFALGIPCPSRGELSRPLKTLTTSHYCRVQPSQSIKSY